MSAAAVLPGSLAAPAKKLVPSGELAPSPSQAVAARTTIPTQRANHAALAAPFAFFRTGLTLETFAADCTTPKSDWNLGETVCVKVDGAVNLSRVQLVNPAGYAYSRADIGLGPQTVSFTIPSDATTTSDDSAFDNRGTWRITLVDAPSAGALLSVPITVHDPQLTVANLQVIKTLGSSQAVAGADVDATVRVFNAGPDAAASVKFTDVPPANTTFQSLVQTAGPTFSCTTPAVNSTGLSVCTTASLGKDEAADFRITYKVSGSVANAADLTSSASAETTTTETASADNGSSDSTTSSNPTPPACSIAYDNVTVSAASGQTGASVTFPTPTVNGTCGTITTSPADGSFFSIGTTQVNVAAGGTQTTSFFVTVTPYQDTQDPSISCPTDISVNESSSSSNAANVTYTAPTASDDSGTVNVNCSPASGSSFPVGTTEVRCTATDPSDNVASCSFNVTVNDIACSIDSTSPAPVPNVASLPTITRACSVTLLAADDPTATDACGGTISGDTASDRTYNVPGSYTVVWTYNDGTHTTTQNQTVTILPDNSPPVPDAASLPDVTGECSAAITGEPPTATDNCGGSGLEGVALDPLSYTTAGTHVVRWRFTDAAGNSTIQTQNVVVTDTHPPVVTLTGASSVTVECHTSYTDAGATATDNCSAPVTPTSSSDVNVNVPGTYHVVWSATDGGNNTASATRTVVVSDTIKPVITLNGANPMTILLHSTFTDPGASASDSCAGPFAATASGTVNNNAVGTYTITYNATDPSGNAADPVTRTVNVIYDFSGFFSPINNAAINQVNAGRSIPVKFNLAGNQGLGIMAAGSPYSQQVTCGSNNVSDLQETGTAGSSSLSYDSGSNQYIYVWKTESSWAGTCRVLTVALIDGTTHTATFKFK
ncbi:MAG: PxKF domain-containing protein [Pyrinomonadaceae bacterium]